MDPVPLTGTQTVHPNNEQKNVPQPDYSDEAKTYILFRRQRMIAARDARDMIRDEHDGLPFLKYMDILKKHDDQFIQPRKNKQDTAINVGTIRDKDTTLVELACKFDYEPIAQCYDQDDEVMEELAETGEDLVRKSLMIEDFKAKQKLVFRSMVAFGTAFVEDQWVERWTIEKAIGKGAKIGDLNVEWTNVKKKTYDGAQSKLWDIRKCFPGDVRKFFLNGPQGQPFFFTVEYETFDVIKQMFGDFDRFKFVPDTVITTAEMNSAQTYSSWWTLRPVTANYGEIIRYYDPVMNEYGLMINGIDMLPIMDKPNPDYKEGGPGKKNLVSGFPLTAISPSGAIPYAKYDLEPMHEFWLSKSQPGKMRVLADVENMWYKIILRMLKQKANPTLGNKSGRNFGAEVTDPATVINDVRDGDLFPILPNFTGPAAADFTFYKMTKDELSRNSVQDSYQGIDNQPGEETATEDMNNRKAQSLDVSAMFDGIISGHTQLYWLRTFNLFKNWTKPIDVQIDTFKKTIENKYRTVSVPSEIDGGQKAMKKIVFTKDTPVRPNGKATLEDSQDMHMQELKHKDDGKGEVRITNINPDVLVSMKLNWFYTCIPIPNDNDPLAYMVFGKQIIDAQTFFGPQALNVKKLKYVFAKKTGQDYDTWFISQQELDQKQAAAAQMGGGANAAGGAPSNIPGQTVGGGQPTNAGVGAGSNPVLGMGALMK